MTFRSCDCRRVRLLPEQSAYTVIEEAGEGAFCFGTEDWLRRDRKLWNTIYLHLPYDTDDAHGHHSVHTLRIYQEGDPIPPKPSWQWDGNEDTPTLTPSIACGMPKGCDWHGYMTAGRLEAHE